MSKSYYEIEKLRTTTHKYVSYDFFKLYDGLTDMFDINQVHCNSFVGAVPGKLSKAELIQGNGPNHNYFSGIEKNTYHEIEKIIVENFRLTTTSEIINKICILFRHLTTVNSKNDERVKSLLFGGARINFENLIHDIKLANKDLDKIFNILNILSQEVNICALNGAFNRFAISLNYAGKCANAPKDYDKDIRKAVIDLYDKYVPNFPFPEKAETPFTLADKIYNFCKELEAHQNLSQNELFPYIKYVEKIILENINH